MKKNKLIFIIFIAILIAFGIIYYIFFGRNIIKQKRDERGLQEATQKVSEYLYDKYNQNFNLELSSEGYKTREIWIDTYLALGNHRNIKEYVFNVYTDELPVYSYTTLWKNLITNDIEIEEVNGKVSNHNYTDYKTISTCYKEKQEIRTALEELLGNNKEYIINYDYEKDKIKINIMHDFKEALEKDLNNLENIMEIRKDKDYISIIVEFADLNTIEYSLYTKAEKEKNFWNCAKQVNEYLKENYKLDYFFEISGRLVEIRFNETIEDKYYSKDKEKYIKLFDDIYNFSIKYDTEIIFEFSDKSAIFEDRIQRKSLEDYIEYWK